jgi:hypothetical protein
MKKLLLLAIIVGGSIAFTSCSKSEKCVCADGTEVTEDDMILGISLDTYCDLCAGTME